MSAQVRTAIVLGGGGVLGAVQVGMLRALIEHDVRPDVIVGTSVGALNGAVLAALPPHEVADRLTALWSSPQTQSLFAAGTLRRLHSLARSGVAAHSAEPLRQAAGTVLDGVRFEDLPIPFTCCAARIEDATEHWFDRGPVLDAVLASCAVPGLLPPVHVDGHHFYDGGLVNSIPLGRAVELGAERVFVLHVGRVERRGRAGGVAVPVVGTDRPVDRAEPAPLEQRRLTPGGPGPADRAAEPVAGKAADADVPARDGVPARWSTNRPSLRFRPR